MGWSAMGGGCEGREEVISNDGKRLRCSIEQ